METYTFLRQMADSWALLALFLIFAGVIVFAFRPAARPLHRAASEAIFRHEDRPADRPAAPETDA